MTRSNDRGAGIVPNVDVVIVNHLVEELNSLRLSHITDTQPSLALRLEPPVICSRDLLFGIQLPDRPVVTMSLL